MLEEELAGSDTQAAEYHEMAARHARSVFANREALAHYRVAMALGHPEPAVVHEGAGDMCVLLGEYQEALDAMKERASAPC